MRICFISLGTFTHIGPYLDYFKEAGHDVHFVSLSPGPERDVPTYNVGYGKRYSATEGKWKYPLSMLRARWLIKKLRPDIVHTHYATSGGLTGVVCGFHPTIVTVHGSDLTMGIKSRIWRALLKTVFNHADYVNTVSEDLKDMVLSLGICPDKVEVLTLGVDAEKFAYVERAEIDRTKPLRLVCTRRLEHVYDHLTIIKALAILKEKSVKFHMTFVGDGSLRNDLEELTGHCGLREHVTFVGAIDNDELPQILSEHDVYLSASLWDGTSLCLLEAMATGLFPIVSDIKANSSWIEHGVTGFLHKVCESDDLARYILKLHDTPQLMINASKINRKKVVESGDRRTNMELLGKIYAKLIKD
jgi:glycosyltransferase involved in cell wall biosynthesis